jgi:hypothetical protein
MRPHINFEIAALFSQLSQNRPVAHQYVTGIFPTGWIAPNGDTAQKIEILGNGQQLVVAGIHPETGLPYNWHGGEPDKIKLDELKPAAGNGHATPANGATEWPGERADRNQLVANIHAGAALHDSTRDLAAGLIAKGLDARGTIAVLRSLMHASSAERDARWRERLDDIPNLVNGAAGKFAKPAPEPITPYADSRHVNAARAPPQKKTPLEEAGFRQLFQNHVCRSSFCHDQTHLASG